jgi:hypothetical protein
MALGLDFGTGSAGDGESLLSAFTKINTFLSTTTPISGGDLTINDVRVGRGSGNISSNTVFGASAGQSNTTGSYNSAFGLGSMNSNQGGSRNAAFGGDSLFYNISGSFNTAIGNSALINTTGSENTGVGYGAGQANTSFSNTTCLGANTEITASNQIQLGNSATTTYVYGTVQNRSDIRDKAEVRDTVLGLDFINKLRPVDYKWDMREDYKAEMPTQGELSKEEYKILMDEWLESVKLDNITHDGTNTRTRYHHGLIAQEVQDVIQASGVDFGGFQDHSINGGQDVLSVGYTELIAPMIKAIQELTARINVLEGN